MTKHPLKRVFPDVPIAEPYGESQERRTTKVEVIGTRRARLLFEPYGIRENPFGPTPDPRFQYESGTHAEAKSALVMGLECGVGFQALIAPPGMGKTTILFQLLQRFQELARTAFVFQIQGDSRDFLSYLLSELGSDEQYSDLVRVQEAINKLLVREFREGRSTIIVVDEAQNLDTAVLETIRLLSNFETSKEKLLHIILAGQPRLADRLADPELAQLRQRIPIFATLVPFDLEDTSNYVKHRLQVAGCANHGLFTPGAVRLIWENSRGIPRNINTLCFNALLLARSANQLQIDESILQEVISDRQLDPLRLTVEAVPGATHELKAAQRLAAATPHPHRPPPWPILDAAISFRLSEIARQLQVSTGAEAVSIALDEGGQMVCRVKIGSTGPEIDSRVNTYTGLMGSCIRAAAILHCDDSEQDNRANSAACREFGIRSVTYIPICEQQSVIGVCGLLSSRPAAFQTISDVQLQSFADEILSVLGGRWVDPGIKVVPETANDPTDASKSPESELAPSTSRTIPLSDLAGEPETWSPVPESILGLEGVTAGRRQSTLSARTLRWMATIAGALVAALLLIYALELIRPIAIGR
jgi:type II secretory pathway predicted ATPase ExeA